MLLIFSSGCDRISSDLDVFLGEEYHSPVGGEGMAILAVIKLGISFYVCSCYVEVKKARLLVAEFLFRITFAATLVVSEHFNLKDDTVT